MWRNIEKQIGKKWEAIQVATFFFSLSPLSTCACCALATARNEEIGVIMDSLQLRATASGCKCDATEVFDIKAELFANHLKELFHFFNFLSHILLMNSWRMEVLALTRLCASHRSDIVSYCICICIFCSLSHSLPFQWILNILNIIANFLLSRRNEMQ